MRYGEALNEIIAKWNSYPIEDEWVFERFRDAYIKTMSTSEAFDAINETILALVSERDESTATEILQTVIGLATQSQTTEIPAAILENKDVLAVKFSAYGEYAQGKLVELLRFYRLE